jgi:hypothetical protein
MDKLNLNLPIVVASLSEGFSKFFDNCGDKNTFNYILSPNSRISRLYAQVLGEKIPKYEFLHMGNAVPDHISKKMLESLKLGRTHHLISSIDLLNSAIDAYSTPLPTPDFLSSDNSKINLWIVEPELMDTQKIQKSLDFGLFAKQWAPKAQLTVNFIMSKEMMSMIPTFRDILSNYTDNELKQRLLFNLGINLETRESMLPIQNVPLINIGLTRLN